MNVPTGPNTLRVWPANYAQESDYIQIPAIEYIACWLKVLKNDKRAIFQAAAHAQRATEYLPRLQPGYREPPPEAAFGFAHLAK